MGEVEELASRLAPGGGARCPVRIMLPCSSHGAPPAPPVAAVLTLRLVSLSQPAAGAPAEASGAPRPPLPLPARSPP